MRTLLFAVIAVKLLGGSFLGIYSDLHGKGSKGIEEIKLQPGENVVCSPMVGEIDGHLTVIGGNLKCSVSEDHKKLEYDCQTETGCTARLTIIPANP